MKIKLISFISFGIVLLLLVASCSSQFEKIRTSGDTNMVYKKALEYYDAGEYQKAQTLFELVISSFRGKEEAEDLYYKYAYTYYYLERYILASYYFKNFAQTYSTSHYREEVDFMAAYSNYQLSPTFRLDQTYSEKAIDGFQLFVNTFPESERVTECNQLIDVLRKKQERKTFEEGVLYFDLRQYQASMHTFENLLKDFPETNDAVQVKYLVIKASYLLAENSIVTKQEERYRETVDKASEFLFRHKDSEYKKEVNDIYTSSTKKLNQISNAGYKKQSARAGS